MKKLNQGDIHTLANAIAQKLSADYFIKDAEHGILRDANEITPKIAQALNAFFGSEGK